MSKVLKSLIKTLETQKNTLNNYSPESKKSKSQIDQDYYQKNKEKKKQQRRERYQQQKLQTQQKEQKNLSNYYGAEAIKILMSFKEYTELNKEKHKLWLDFNWTLKDCRESFLKGFGDVVAVMKLEQVAGRLVRDYWTTAKSEGRKRTKSWNILDYDEQQKLIRYWAYEKTRVENGYLTETEKLERQSQKYLKKIERAKFHEERGKIKCDCSQCEFERELRKEVKAEIREKEWNQRQQKKIIEQGDEEQEQVESECANCYQHKKVDSESGLCRKCSREGEL